MSETWDSSRTREPATSAPVHACIDVNGVQTALPADLSQRTVTLLREGLGLRGTKVGCQQGDCGSCTILVDGAPVYACTLPVGRLVGRRVVTIEGLPKGSPCGAALQDAFLRHQAVQCGFCIPGMLTAAAGAIDAGLVRDRDGAKDAIAGVLCRCTGYQKIVDAVTEVGTGCSPRSRPPSPLPGGAVGVPVTRLDGGEKVDGSQHFGSDGIPADSLYLRAVRSPHHRARFRIGDLDAFLRRHPGMVRVMTHRDVPALNLHGVATPYADQPVLPVGEVRHHMEAVALLVGERQVLEAFDMDDFPIDWTPLDPLLATEAANQAGAPLLHDHRAGNILVEGLVRCGDADSAIASAAHVVTGTFQSSFVEHAYLEPEAGWAMRRGGVIEIHSPTQAPHPHRADLARILGIRPEDVHVKPTAVGGGFGGKLDMTVQPLLAIAAWHVARPVAMVFSREESIASSTKRHPARITSTMAADADGRLCAVTFHGDYNTGAYASWGSAVANRVPVHAGGPYRVAHYRAHARAIHTNITPAGAFRGFGVPQTLMSQEQLVDALAAKVGLDPLEFRLRNALVPGDAIPTGQVLHDSVGLVECLQALRPEWEAAKLRTAERNRSATPGFRFGLGLAAFFYGCGNTALPNPSTVRIGVRPDGHVVLHQGAVDAGQGSNTVIPQIAADAVGIPLSELKIIGADTNLTPDCGRTSASRQTFITGKASLLAGTALRAQVFARLGVSPESATGMTLRFGAARIVASCAEEEHVLDLSRLPANEHGYVLMAEERFDPPTTSLDAAGQGSPYATYAFGAQMAEVSVDCETGYVRVLRVVAAHDVGRMVNPTLLEGQIEGAVAQGVGMALMEKFHPGINNNLHDYLIPAVHDVPEVKTLFVETHAAIGPYGAKGIGEPALVPTAAAILNAIHHATGARIHHAPATPEVVRNAIAARAAAPH